MRLLLIEDEPELLRLFAAILREEDFAVDTAADGEDGLDKALAADYDTILLDVMLPKLDGWEVLRRLREHKHTPVIMITARDRTSDRVRGLDGGADDYLVKPFEIKEMLARIRAVIRRSANQTQSRIDIWDVRIDLCSRSVSKAGELIKLPARQFALLEYLALHRGTVITRTTLYEHLFDENESSLSNLLDVYVSNLRKKLGADFITTHRGHGYCIEP